ncbi:MAG: amidohydrolase family protein [Candidatus Aminicenantes bacterium]|nr:amidohydrolase family protein [Candidatus Aminicenantes bacterium]
MKKFKKISGFIVLCLFFSTLLSAAETTILKNAAIYLPDGSFQKDSFILLKGCKIQKTGLMKEISEEIFDNEYDLTGTFVYPAFIDPFYKGFQEEAEKEEERDKDSKEIFGLANLDRDKRAPFEKRKFFIEKRVIDIIQIKKSTARKIIAKGFALVHVVPNKGVINGTTGVVSLISPDLSEAIMVPEKFMFLPFKTNSRNYPTTHAALMAELKQLKEDSLYHQKMKKLQFYHETAREKYKPGLDILFPYFTGKKRFLIATKNLVEQHMVEILKKELKIDPVLAVSSDAWRRKIPASADIILPLRFKAPMISRYAQMGDKLKKEAKEKIYPQKIAAFFKAHRNISLAAPDSGDYDTLFANIRLLLKQGVLEADIIKALTINPARLLNIEKFTGEMKPGMLANLIVCDKKIFEEKAKIDKMFVEGKLFDFKTRVGAGKPPVTDLTGNWKVKIESPMGGYQVKMILEQEGNDLSGTLSSPMGSGAMDIEEGYISADEISFSFTIDMGNRQMTVEVSGKVKGKRIAGTMSLGSFGEGTFVATPDM